MSRRQKQGLASVLALLVSLGAGGIVLVLGTSPADRDAPAHRINLVVRDMAFYLADRPGAPNPALELPAGEPVAITVRNAETGTRHDLAIELGGQTWRTRPLDGGESAMLLFTVPARPGPGNAYRCTFHPLTMTSDILIQ